MLLILPLKTTKRLDLETPLKKWVDTSHPHFSASQIATDIKRLDSIRADISKSLASDTAHSFALSSSNNALEDFIEYHACLVECVNRGFPSESRDADVNGTMDANLHFWWRSAFSTMDGQEDSDSLPPQSTTHFTYERASILWNIAALYTYKAAKEHWDTKDGRTAVHKSYSIAAAILRHIQFLLKNSNTKESHISQDLSHDCLEMCQQMCLAQGQITAYEALKVKLTEPDATTSTYTLLSKVAAGVAEHANKALEASQGLTIKGKKSSTTWGGHFKVMSMLFHARAEFLQSQVERRNRKYGQEIARLNRAVDMAVEGKEFMKTEGFVKLVDGPTMLGKIPTNLQSLLVNVKQRRKIIVEENIKIYLDKVPSESALQKIEGKDVMYYDEEKDSELADEFMPASLARPMFATI